MPSVRRVWSTTSTTVWPGGSFRSSSPPAACRSTRSPSSPRSTRPCGVWGSLAPARSPICIGRKPLIDGGHGLQAAGIFLIAATVGFLPWAGRCGAPGTRHRDGLSHAAGGDRRRRPPRVAGLIGRRLPALARRRVRRRRASGRRRRRSLGVRWAIGAVGVLTLLSSAIVATVMTETLAARRTAAVLSATRPTPGTG